MLSAARIEREATPDEVDMRTCNSCGQMVMRGRRCKDPMDCERKLGPTCDREQDAAAHE